MLTRQKYIVYIAPSQLLSWSALPITSLGSITYPRQQFKIGRILYPSMEIMEPEMTLTGTKLIFNSHISNTFIIDYTHEICIVNLALKKMQFITISNIKKVYKNEIYYEKDNMLYEYYTKDVLFANNKENIAIIDDCYVNENYIFLIIKDTLSNLSSLKIEKTTKEVLNIDKSKTQEFFNNIICINKSPKENNLILYNCDSGNVYKESCVGRYKKIDNNIIFIKDIKTICVYNTFLDILTKYTYEEYDKLNINGKYIKILDLPSTLKYEKVYKQVYNKYKNYTEYDHDNFTLNFYDSDLSSEIIAYFYNIVIVGVISDPVFDTEFNKCIFGLFNDFANIPKVIVSIIASYI